MATARHMRNDDGNHARCSVGSALFVIVVLAILASPAALCVAQHIPGLNLPSWLTVVDAEYLSGSRETPDIRSQATIEGIQSGDFQREVEVAVGNYIPCKALALLANAAIERSCIEVANMPFSWDCYPTYLGSSVVYYPEQGALVNQPSALSDSQAQGWAEFVRSLADFARRHPDKRFVLYVVQSDASVAANPAIAHVAGAVDSSEAVRIFMEAAAGVDNLIVLTCDYDTSEEYYHDFFRTDQHWNAYGALRAYNTIASSLDLVTVDQPAARHVSLSGELEDGDDGYRFVGALSRNGLYMLSEDAFDLDFDFSQVTVTKIDGIVGDGNDHEAFAIYPDAHKAYVFHSHYYDNLTDCTTVGPGEGSALLIGDSYRGVIQRLIMTQYGQLTASSDLHHSIVPAKGLEELVAESGADDIIMVATPADYYILWQQDPTYFD